MALLTIILVVAFNKALYKSYFNPIFLQSVLWLLYYFGLKVNISHYDIYITDADKFVLLQLAGFSLGGLICYLFTSKATVTNSIKATPLAMERALKNLNKLFPVVLAVLIFALIALIQKAGFTSIFNIADFREELSQDDGKAFGLFGIIQYMVSTYLVLYFAATKKVSLKFISLLLPFFYFTLLLGSRSQFFFFFFPLFYLLVWQKKIRKTVFLLSGAILVFFIVLVTVLRTADIADKDVLIDTVLVYTVTSIPALVLSYENPSYLFGFNTFRIAYVWLNKIGFSFVVAPVVSPFIGTPLVTNVYSYIKPYYLDFGYAGVFIFPLLLGFMHNWLFYRAEKGNLGSIVLTALLIYPLFMQVFEENYFRWASNWVYFAILILGFTKINIHEFRRSNNNIQS